MVSRFAFTLALPFAITACGPATVIVERDPADIAAGEGEGEGEDAKEGEGEGAGEGAGEGEGEAPVDEPTGPVRYADGAHSPLTPDLVARWRALILDGRGRPNVFAKIGASNTVNTGFATCLDAASADLDLDGRDLEDTRLFFAAGNAGGTSPFDRVSQSATVGWSCHMPLRGDPRPLDVELDAIEPAFAVVMFGTNDIQLGNIQRTADDYLALLDALLARGVLPIVQSIPPRDDDADADVEVPRYNLLFRALAEARQVPFMDLEQRLRPLATHGIGGDGIHLNRDPRGGCFFDDAGLEYGFNQRNLQLLEALDRLRRVVVDEEAVAVADHPTRSALRGQGTSSDPIVVDTLPFTHENTTVGGERAIASYACAPNTDESGPERTYVVDVDRPGTLHALVFDQGDVDVDVHLLRDGDCLVRHDREAVFDVTPGRYRVVFDTFAGDARAGTFQTIIMLDE